MVQEARLEETSAGLEPSTEGWFVVNARKAAWLTNGMFGAACIFEGKDVPFDDLGIRLRVVWPGQPNCLYHAESNQESFLILDGECLLLVEGQERRLRAWDFVHCPAGTEHVFVGAGDGPCVILMVGARTKEFSIVYPVSELARRHGASVETETTSPDQAYARFPEWRHGREFSGSPLSNLLRQPAG